MRRARPEDVERAAAILEEAAGWLRSRGIEQWPARFQREVIADDIRCRDCYLAWEGAEPVGTFCLQDADQQMWGDRPPDALYLHRLAVRRSHAGLGRELLAWAERATAEAGKRYVRLDCWAANPGLRAYYERAGYVHQGEKWLSGGFTASLYEKAVRSR